MRLTFTYKDGMEATLLIIDDSRTVRAVLLNFLKDEGLFTFSMKPQVVTLPNRSILLNFCQGQNSVEDQAPAGSTCQYRPVDQAATIAERVREVVESMDFEGELKPLELTISPGVATFHRPDVLTADDLIRVAGHPLYRAKDADRNRVELSEVTH